MDQLGDDAQLVAFGNELEHAHEHGIARSHGAARDRDDPLGIGVGVLSEGDLQQGRPAPEARRLVALRQPEIGVTAALERSQQAPGPQLSSGGLLVRATPHDG